MSTNKYESNYDLYFIQVKELNISNQSNTFDKSGAWK